MKNNFNIIFTVTKENMAFSKMKPICELEERHGISLGRSYKNNQACTTFFEYALERRNILAKVLSRSYLSIDSGNMEDELFIAVYLDYKATDKRVHIRNPLFSVQRLERRDAHGLLMTLEPSYDTYGH